MHHILRARLGILIASRVYRGVVFDSCAITTSMQSDRHHPARENVGLSGCADFLHLRTLGLFGSTSKHPDTLKFVPILSEDDRNKMAADHHVKAITG